MTRLVNFPDGFTTTAAPPFSTGGYEVKDLQTLSDGDEVAIDSETGFQIVPLISDDGFIDINTIPFGTDAKQDGMLITLMGTSDTDAPRLKVNDDDDGCLINGDCLLKRGYTITLQRNNELKRYLEIGRTQ
jgi:hypothetical protein